MKEVTHWIDGKPWTGTPERTGDVYDPATGTVTGHVHFAGSVEVDTAVAAARRAYETWRDVPLSRRTAIFFALRDLVDRHRRDLAELVTAEHGKTLEDADSEVRRGLDVIEFACGIPHLLKGEMVENVSTAVDSYSIRQPVGVAAGITPFNFPVMVPLWMCPIAIACGNAFVLKPSEKDPSPSVRLAEMWAEAGLPDGVFNVVHGDKAAVDRLLTHSDVAAVSFVGSTPVARHVYETGAAAGKRVQALGGAKNHMIVLPDAVLDAAADAAVSGGFGSAGERCMAVSAIVAVEPVADRLVAEIEQRMSRLRVGDGRLGVDMGPLVTAEHRDRVAAYLDAGVAEGARLVVDGRHHPVEAAGQGFWLGPSLFDQVTPEMSIYRDEIFGPVLIVVRVASLGDALDLINANPYGNGVAIFTSDGALTRRFQHDVQIGMIGINVPVPVPMAYFSFGGWKASLFGDASMYGPEGVRFYTRMKTVTVRWPGSTSGQGAAGSL